MGRGARARALAPWLVWAVALAAPMRASAQDDATHADAAPTETPPVTMASALTLEAPSACPAAELLRDELASLVGRPLDGIALPAGLDPHVVVTVDGPRFALEVRDAEGVRTLHDRSCSALVRAAALIVALRIDADAATLAAASASEPSPTQDPQAAQPTTTPRPPVVRIRRRRRRPGEHDYDAFEWSQRLANPFPAPTLSDFAIGAGVMVEGGLVPSFTASFVVDALVRVDHFEVRLRGGYALEESQDHARAGVAASAVTATALLCGRPFGADFAIAICGGIEGGTLLAHTYGISNSAQTAVGTVAGVVGLWLPLFPWHGIDVSLGAEVWGRFYGPEFVVTGLGHVWDADWFGGRFALLVHFSP